MGVPRWRIKIYPGLFLIYFMALIINLNIYLFLLNRLNKNLDMEYGSPLSKKYPIQIKGSPGAF